MQGIFRWEFARAVARKFVPHGKMMAFGRGWSQSNREKHVEAHVFKGDGEGVVRFARKYLRRRPVELFVFGHLHAPAQYRLSEGAMLYVLGDWITERPAVYGRMDGEGFGLREFGE